MGILAVTHTRATLPSDTNDALVPCDPAMLVVDVMRAQVVTGIVKSIMAHGIPECARDTVHGAVERALRRFAKGTAYESVPCLCVGFSFYFRITLDEDGMRHWWIASWF